MFGFSVISTYAAAISSFEGLIYLKVPFIYHIQGIPEAIIWLSLFIGILYVSIKYKNNKIVSILPVIFMLFIVLIGLMVLVNMIVA